MDASVDRFTWGPETVLSQCAYCTRLEPDSAATVCLAFPGGIPLVILENGHDHREPFLDPGTDVAVDIGEAGEESILFEPRPQVPAAVLERLYEVLDAASA